MIRFTTDEIYVWFPLPDKPGMKVSWTFDRWLQYSKPREENHRLTLQGGTLEAMTPEDQAEVWIPYVRKTPAIALAAVVAPAA